MVETLHCPGCQAQLVLPALPDGQSVQCPRCQRVFEPARQRAQPHPVAPRVYIPPLDVADDDRPLDHRLTRAEPLRGVWTAYVAMTLLAISVVSFGVQAYLAFEHAELARAQRELGAPRLVAGGGFALAGARRPRPPIPPLEMRWRRWENASAIATRLHQLAVWPTAIVFLIWLCQSSGNLWTLQARGLSHTPGTAVAMFFVPILNVYRPYMVVQEIWRASHPSATASPQAWIETPRSRLTFWWWFFFLSAPALYVFSLASEPRGLIEADDLGSSLRASTLANLCMVVAGALLIAIIRQIGRRQHERYLNLYDDAV